MSDAPRPVVIVPYNHAWPERFERERAVLAELFAGERAMVEHVGSTAVPGLAAKPIVDILVGVDALAVVETRIPALEGAGYEYVPEFEARLPGRRYFRKPRTGARTVHLHCVESGGAFFREHVLFRDYLRTRPDAAREYETLKRELASRFDEDRWGYTEAKSAFIEATLDRARSEGV